MIHRIVLLLCFAVATLSRAADSAPAVPATITAETAFARLKSLAGDWTGTVKQRDGGPPVVVKYRLTAGGSAVMETLFPGTAHEMVTVYHRNGAKLVLTHYCAMGNQPEMELAPDSTETELRFAFTGGANITPEQDTHMHEGRITFRSADAIDAHWNVWVAGKPAGTNDFFLTRAVPPKS